MQGQRKGKLTIHNFTRQYTFIPTKQTTIFPVSRAACGMLGPQRHAIEVLDLTVDSYALTMHSNAAKTDEMSMSPLVGDGKMHERVTNN